jgi:hypothetical protein
MDLTLQLQRVEAVPVRHQVRAFRGIVKDFSGAMLPGARIVVVKRGSQAKDVVLTDKANANGEFSAQIPEGSYIAIFFSRGFRPAIEAFDVTQVGTGEIPVNLRPGSCP